MRKFFGKQGWNRVLSVVLVMALVAGVVGVYPIMAEANETVPEGIFTVEELKTGYSSFGLSATQTNEGVSIAYPSESADAFARVITASTYSLNEYGIHLDITNIACSTRDDYSFAMYFGNATNPLYDQDGYMLVYENSGVFSIIATGITSDTVTNPTPKNAPKVIGPITDVEPLGGKISLDIKLVDDKYVLNVNGNSYTIAAKYQGDTTQAIQDVSNVRLSFAILDDGLADNSFSYSQTFACATYTIGSITYNVGGVTLDASALSMVPNQTTNLTATVFPDNVSNKTVTWKSSDESVVTVDDNGNVTAVAEGNATVIVTSNADTTKSTACEVKVTESGLTVDDFVGVNVTNATFTDVANSGGVQITYPITASGSERIQTVNTYPMQNGVSIQIDDIKGETGLYSVALAIGNDTQQWNDKVGYMLIFGQGGNFIISQTPSGEDNNNPDCSVIASDNTLGKLDGSLSITIKKQDSDYKIWVNGKEYVIQDAASVLGTSGEHYIAFGVMSDFAVTDGEASGLKHWHYGYYAQAWGSIGRSEDVSYIIRSITVSPSSVSLDKEYINLFANESATVAATVSPLAASQNVNWSSADEAIATVNADGTVTGVKAGTTVITATSKTDASITASCVVKVTNPAEYLKKEHLATNQLATGSETQKTATTAENVDNGIKVSFTAESQNFHRLETKYDQTTPANNYTLKYNGYWPEGNGVHIGFKDIELTNDTDTLVVFVGKRNTSTHKSAWYDTEGGAYMLFYGNDGSFAIVETCTSWSGNYIEKVHVAEKRELLTDRLSLDVREEDGRYELLVNGKAYSLPAEGDECPIPRTTSTDRLHFAFGLMTGFNVTEEGVMTGPAIKTVPNYSSNGTFTITDISYVTTEELATADYVQRTSLANLDGNYVLGKNELAATTAFGATDFNGTLDDSCEGLMWEITSIDGGYSVKKAGGDENSYLNISSAGVSLGAMQPLTIERISDTTTSYFAISDGTTYLSLTESGVSVSNSSDKLILYNVRPELAEATEEKPLFTLSTFSDLHGEWVYDSGEKYIRNGIVDATKKVREEDNANVIAFLGDLISDKNYDATEAPHGYWYAQGSENVESEWKKARDLMYVEAESATESGRALYLAGNHEYAIGGTRANPTFNSGDFTDGIESKLPELTEKNAYFQKEADFPEGTSQDIIDAGHVLSYHYNIDGMDIIAINPSYTGAEITKDWSYDLGALEWMEDKLAQIGSDKTVLVLGHYPTSSLDDYEAGMPSYNKIKQIFADYPNVIYLYGHDHNPYIHTDTYQRVQTFAADGVTPFQNRYETPTGYTEAFGGSVAFANDVGLASSDLAGTPAVVQGLLVKVYSDRIVLQMKNYNESPLGVDALREYTIMRDVKLNVKENPQEAQVEEYTTAFKNFRSGEEKEAPVAPKGYVFAGWYYDEACTEPVSAGTTTVAEDKQIFANFLPESVLSVQAQSRYSTTDNETIDTSKIDLRLVTMVDDLKYKEVGFLVTNRSETVKRYSEHYAFFDLTAAGYNFKPGDFNDCCTRFITINMVNIPISGTGFTADREIPVQAYWITQDGTTVYGPARTIKVSTAVANVGNAN